MHHKSWKMIKEELRISDTVIVPLGSLEAHGEHNPVGCCFLLAEAASRDVGEKTGVNVMPVIPFGVSKSYTNFPGTITVSSDTLHKYVYDVCISLVRTGFKKIVFFSAHGGNNLPVLREISFKLREEHGALCAVLHIWGLIQQLTPPNFWDKNQRLGHGGEPTTSVMLYLFPDLVDMAKADLKPLRQPMQGIETTSYSVHRFKDVPVNVYLFAEEVEKSGFMGDPTKASKEKGEILYNNVKEFLIEFVESFMKLNPSLKQEP